MKSADFRPVTSSEPCAICGKGDWCRRSDDGCHECHRSPETDPPGFKLQKTTQGGFGLYRRIGDEQCQSNHIRRNGLSPELYASPDDAVAAMLVWPKLRGARKAGSWTYLKADGDTALKVVRFERDDGSKEFRPMRPVGDKWAIGGPPGKLPVYRLPAVLEAKRQGKTIHVVEGEGCADALWSIGLPATTSANGCKSAGKTDWTSLAGADVVILPDNDPPGETYAEAVATLVSSLQPRAAVRIVRLPDVPEKGDIVDHIARLDSRDDADIVRGIEELAKAAEPWAAKRAVGQGVVTTPNLPMSWQPFPTNDLPEPVRSLVRECAKSIVVDEAFVAPHALAVCAGAIGTTRRIALNEDWTEPAILWTAVVAKSGTTKSPPLEKVLQPVNVEQDAAFVEYEDEIEAYKARKREYDADIAIWKRKKAENRDEQPKEPELPACRRFIIQDVTIEAVAALLQENPRGLLLARDELAGLFDGMGQYKKNRGSDTQGWIELYHGRTLTVDRKTGDLRVIRVRNAGVSICGTIQPRTLARVLTPESFENGFAPRWMMVMPPTLRKRWSNARIKPAVRDSFAKVIQSLLGLTHEIVGEGPAEPRNIVLSREAQAIWEAHFEEFAKVQYETLDDDLRAAMAKHEGGAARLALVIHMIRWAAGDVEESPVDETSIRAGIRLATWFTHETERIYANLQETTEQTADRELIAWIRKRGGQVTVRELCQNCRRYRQGAQAREALDRLAASGVGETASIASASNGGRPREVFRLKDYSDGANKTSA